MDYRLWVLRSSLKAAGSRLIHGVEEFGLVNLVNFTHFVKRGSSLSAAPYALAAKADVALHGLEG